MHRELIISPDPIDEHKLLESRQVTGNSGAVVSFLGVVRGTEESRSIQALEYEAFAQMAEHRFHVIFDQVEKRWPVISIRLVHRTGSVRVGEASLWVEVVAPHRGEAFTACEFLIEE